MSEATSALGRSGEIVSEDRLLTMHQCQEVRAVLYSLRGAWIARLSRKPRCTYFTLGPAASYDVRTSPNPTEEYFGRIRDYNILLLTHFGDVLESVRSALEHRLKAPVKYSSEFALPGFHIFRSGAIVTSAQGPPHLDMQYTILPWRTRWDDAAPLSFTLAISLPSGGSGLQTWNITFADTHTAYTPGYVTDLASLMQERGGTFHPYTCGSLFVHQGLLLHRIAAPIRITPKDERITLQGHGLRLGGEWHLYW
jgi:hypothetical protein